ncbi:MAG: glycosyltransferase family 1 protein [Planctomycetota bacterium]|nr:glycosyltransferase family 1 protein [Planctomycetota bacterium]
MKALFLPVGSHGDVHPHIGIAKALKARGHDVTVITNGHFGPLARREGLGFCEIGSDADYREALKDPDLWHPTRGPKKVMEFAMLGIMRPMYELVAALYEPGNTVVVAAGLALGARVAQDKLGIPTVTLHLQPAVFRSFVDPPKLPGAPLGPWAPAWWVRFFFRFVDWAIIDRLLCPKLNAFRAELGLPPVKHIMGDWWNSPQRVIALFPDWYANHPPDWPPQVRCVGFPLYDERGVEALPPEVEAFLREGTPPIVFTPGSAHIHAKAFFQESARACAMLGRRGLLLSRFKENVPDELPTGVMHVPYVPFSELLPRAAALVQHGGIGTTAQGLAAGIPQLIVPFSHDQPDNAARLKRMGVGESIPAGRYKAAAAARKLRALLDDPRVAESARAVAKRLEGARPAAAACDLIEETFRASKKPAAV